MKKSDLKRKFFEKGAAALRNISAIEQECYCCPICSYLYLPEALEMDVLTLEHAPPQKVGGKPLALTCKECNSVAGYSVDSAVVQRQKLVDFTEAVMGQKQSFKGRAAFLIGGKRDCFDIFGFQDRQGFCTQSTRSKNLNNNRFIKKRRYLDLKKL